MVEHRSTDIVIASLRNALQDEADPLDWISIELAALERKIDSIRQHVHKMGAQRPRRGGIRGSGIASRIWPGHWTSTRSISPS